ncbi:hypothetical protein [Mycobacterium sp. GA-2829]|uniref:hypothetical protein n=1 Tax=Mycobacterium sp. GA-2829 TaxID=1772283 RepID=UPI0012FB5496|nr:hypothetical protein [Mycobacterium sp. GA-2829]
MTSPSPARHPHSVPVYIDGRQYQLHAEKVVTTADLRRLPRPPLSSDQQLWLDVVDAPDRLLAEGVAIPVTPGMRLFTQPRTITIHIDRTAYSVPAGPMTISSCANCPCPRSAPTGTCGWMSPTPRTSRSFRAKWWN